MGMRARGWKNYQSCHTHGNDTYKSNHLGLVVSMREETLVNGRRGRVILSITEHIRFGCCNKSSSDHSGNSHCIGKCVIKEQGATNIVKRIMKNRLKETTLESKLYPIRTSDIDQIRFRWPGGLGYSGEASVHRTTTVPHLYAACVIDLRKGSCTQRGGSGTRVYDLFLPRRTLLNCN